MIGIDEVGRGAFAGPVVVSALIFKDVNCSLQLKDQINDSKLVKFMHRKKLAKQIKEECLLWTTALVGVPVINKIGIGKATEIAFRKAVANIHEKLLELEGNEGKIPKENLFLLADGFHIKYIRGIGLKHQKAIIKGDQKSLSIAGASIIAKDYRDGVMLRLSKKYPQFGWGRNKGYGTKEHQKAIKEHGLSKIHRTSFSLEKFL